MHTIFQHTYITLEVYVIGYNIPYWMENSVQFKDFEETQIQFISIIHEGFIFFLLPKIDFSKIGNHYLY